MSAGKLDLTIEKGAKFFQAFDVTFDDEVTPYPFAGKDVRCIIKRSKSTDTVMFELTEANGGIQILDEAKGRIAMSIDADQTDVDVSVGFYQIKVVDENDPEDEIDRLLQGKIVFTEDL